MDIAAVVKTVTDNWDNIFVAIGAVVTAASVIVKLTPTQKDDAVLAKVIAFLNWFSVFNPKGTKVVKDAAPVNQADVKTEIVEAQK